MRLAFLFAAAASLFAGAAAACPEYDDCPRRDHHAHGGYGHDGYGHDGYAERYNHDRYRERGHWEDREHEEYWEDHGPRERCWEACGELSLPASFFFDSGGVGPIPDSGFIGGGGGFAFADSFAFSRASASAFASARAHANVSVSVRVRPFKPHHGGKGGKKH